MSYHLLTGASGLLGSYMLRDSLLAGLDMAVIVRPTTKQSAQERVENILTYWEQQLGHELPRPRVFSGNLHHPLLGLDKTDLRWIAHNCQDIVHNAASLSFVGSDRAGEPWLTNVDGTQRVLEMAKICDIHRFHHISTAYVCGQRSDRILETELDVGQDLGNDYERSKVEAEKLIYNAGLKTDPTVYRPSIIVGDSQTGYTSTFHGFFAILKLAHTLATQILRGSTQAQMLLKALRLDAKDNKNLVPVDWVSSMITHVLGSPKHHGRTYHLTAATPTPLADLSRAVHDAVQSYSLFSLASVEVNDARWFENTFRQEAMIYSSYWRDDPQFDRTHTTDAAPHLPCPVVDYKSLMKMARFAIKSRFGKDRHHRSQLLDWMLGGPIHRFMTPKTDKMSFGAPPGQGSAQRVYGDTQR